LILNITHFARTVSPNNLFIVLALRHSLWIRCFSIQDRHWFLWRYPHKTTKSHFLLSWKAARNQRNVYIKCI